MTTIAISSLPVAVSQAAADVLPIVQAATSTTKQLSMTNLFTNSVLVTPILGTPQSGTLTNCTGLPVTTGVSGLGANVAAFLATPSSANLATAVTGETGSGALVFATSPTLATPTLITPTMTAPVLGTVTSGNISACTSTSMVMVSPVLGTPASGVLTNCTGSPTFTDVKYSGLVANTAAAPTIASATTIAPTAPITFISGTTAVVTITAPAPISTGGGTITFIPTGAFTWTTAGNIAVAGTAVVSRTLTFTFDVTTTKWYPSYV
jgi:hypothetical protein